jgi:hypothetical protein
VTEKITKKVLLQKENEEKLRDVVSKLEQRCNLLSEEIHARLP